MTLGEPYLYCGICFKKFKEKTLYLTSCAHVICEDDINLKIKRCPKCNVNDISIIKLEENKIPNSIKEIIEPCFEQLNNIQFASKFQYFQLKELIQIFEKENYYLKEKNNKLKDLLRKSRIELNKCNQYQLTINKLKQENKRLNLKLQLNECSNYDDNDEEEDDDEINEISIDEYRLSSSNKNNRNNRKNGNEINNKENEDFISKLRKFNQLKSIIDTKNNDFNTSNKIQRVKDKKENNELPILNIIRTNEINNNNNSGISSSNEEVSNFSSFNIQAESTGIKKRNRSFSMQQVNDSLNNNDSIINNISPIISSTAGNEWFKKRNNNNNNNSSSSKNFKKLFKFKPPSRNIITSKSGIKIGNNNNNNNNNFNSGFLRSKDEIFKK